MYDLSYQQLREVLLPGESDGLELRVVELVDGSGALTMMLLRRPHDQLPRTDISELASWRAYQQQRR